MGVGETACGLLFYTFAKFADEFHKFCLELGSLQPYPYSTVIPFGILSAFWTADGIIRLYGVLKNNEYKTTGMVGLAYRTYSRLKR
jgi:hypothetical protein